MLMQSSKILTRSSTVVSDANALLVDLEALAHVHGMSEAAASIQDTYARGDDPLMASLAPVLVRSRFQAHNQELLDSERDRLHSGRLTHEERISTGHHYETLRHAACEYNHLLRGFIESHREGITRDELTACLVEASHSHERWTDGEITGAVSEIALHAALMGMPGVSGTRYASLDEDLHGFDFTCEWRGETVTIDAKTGRYPAIVEHLHGHKHLEIYVPRDAMDGFRLTRHGLDSLRREVRIALQQADRLENLSLRTASVS